MRGPVNENSEAALSLFMARNLSSSKRREIKNRKVPPHQRAIDGLLPVYELTLESHFDDDVLYPTQVYMAALQPIEQGHKRHSQTAIVMQALELHGAELARL
jgi:hypothetical protein